MKLSLLITGECIALRDMVALAQKAEAAGFDSLWTGEYFRSYSVPLSIMARATRRVRLGPSVSMGFARSPYLGARTAADIDELSEGRLVLGLGSGVLHSGREDGWMPGRRGWGSEDVRALIEAHRHAWRSWYDDPGAPLEYESEGCVMRIPGFLSTRRPPRREIPIYLGGHKAPLVQLAGELADGFVIFPIASERYLREMLLPNLEIGAKRGGRDLASLEKVLLRICSIAEDGDRARRLARQQLSFQAVDGAGHSLYSFEGFEDESTRINEAWRAGDHEAMAAAVSDEMLDAFALVGEPDEVRARVAELDAKVDSVVLFMPIFGSDAEQILALHHAAIEAFA